METSKSQGDSQMAIPVGQLLVNNNYRRYFNKTAMQELVDSIKTNGLTSPILIRPHNERFEVVAGHRRVKAFTEAFGAEEPIPALCRILTDEEAKAAMVSENKVREDTSAIEDAEAAMALLGLLKGDKEETAKRLGWTPAKLNARLGLMNATDAVRDAYIEEKLKLGHVEVLAALHREVQPKVLAKMLESPVSITVEQLKSMAQQALLNLEAAIFDKKACTGCHFNTAIQQTMFETSFEGSNCSNGECYRNKTESELEARKAKLAESYQVVRIVRPGENLTLVPLRAEGKRGVGEAQALACRTCADFGACVSATPDKLGMTFTDICFNVDCNTKKVKEQVDAESAAQAAQQQTAAASGQTNAEPTDAKSAPTGAKAKQDKAPQKAASSEQRTAVREYRENIWRLILSRVAVKLPVEKNRALLLALCLYRPSTIDSHGASTAIGELVGVKLDKMDSLKLATQIVSLDVQKLSVALQNLPAHFGRDLEIKAVVAFLKALEVKLENHWALNQEICEILTTVELDAVCVEIGIDKAMGKEYDKAKKGKKADFVKAILSITDFEYRGKIPALMRW